MSRGAVISAVLALLAGACGPSQPSSSQRPPGESREGLRVIEVWAPEPAGKDVAAVYLTIVGAEESGDALVGASTKVAGEVQLHRSAIEEGMARMEPVERIPVPPGSRMVLEPGGYHLMLMHLTRRLEHGDSFPLSLRFQEAGTVEVEAAVVDRREAPVGGMEGEHQHQD